MGENIELVPKVNEVAPVQDNSNYISASFDVFKNFMQNASNGESADESAIVADENFIKEQIKIRLASPDLGVDERLKLMELYTNLTEQGSNRLQGRKKENTSRLAIAGGAALLFGLSAYLLDDSKS